MNKIKLLRYSLAIIIGVFLIGAALFENNLYTLFRSKAVLAVIGTGIVVIGVFNVVALLRPMLERKKTRGGSEERESSKRTEEIAEDGERL